MLTGARGQIASEIILLAQKQNIPIIPLDHATLNITKLDAVIKCTEQYQPNVIINAAAYTAVDRAESEREKAFAVNNDGAANIAKVCAEYDIPLIHLSTDYIFNGEKDAPYEELDKADPQNAYGLSKLQGEEQIRQRHEQHIILRTSWVFGMRGQNFVKTMLQLFQKQMELRVVADQRGCPTSAIDIAQVIIDIIVNHLFLSDGKMTTHWGTYHYCGAPATTRFGMAQSIYEEASAIQSMCINKIIPIATNNYPTPAKRPLNSVLNCQKLFETFGIKQPEWRLGLRDLVPRILNVS